jgi:hypothetical protein
MARNFMLGQTLYSYDFHNRSSNSDQNGEPKLMTSADDEDLRRRRNVVRPMIR